MTNLITYPTHNTITFTGKKLKPFFAKLINDTMFEVTGLDGAYLYDVRGNNTIFSIYPKSFEFGDDSNEFKFHGSIYKQIYQRVISQYPESLDE